ncbi:hypothetical protein [Enterovirga sp. CN4-39]|uniref:hypothetical protein n=1 Tax=Enterovirga sp. CN4-39 TaxID=3400910 RepID=UPI003C05A68C
MTATSDPADQTAQSSPPLREPCRRGRPYRAEVVEAVRALLGTELRFAEIAARTGIGEATVGRWSRQFRFADGEGGRAPGSLSAGEGRVARSANRGGEPLAACPPPSGAPRLPPPPSGEEKAHVEGRRRGRHPPETREAARKMVEGTQFGLERIALELGIGTATLARWVKRGRWARPPGPGHIRPPRSRIRRGRPYLADGVELARDLATGTLLSQKRIAAQAGVSQATISNWIRKRGWTRPSPRPGRRRFAARARTAPLAETGSRRGKPYAPEIVAEARRLFVQTELPTLIIASRLWVTPVTVARWAREGGWTRPRDLPEPDGSRRRRRRRRRRVL